MMETHGHADRHIRLDQGSTTPPSGGNGLLAPLESQTLLNGQRERLIRHQGQLYRLQATRQGKLILTK